MDLERNQLKISFSHCSTLFVSSSASFRIVKLILDAKNIPVPDNINLHMKSGELIYNDLNRTFSASSKAEVMLEKVVGQMKYEKENSRALST